MPIYRKLKYKNPYTVKKNIFLFTYSILNTPTNNMFFKSILYLLKIVFDRLAFVLLKFGFKFQTLGAINGKVFRLRAMNSQFHSIYFDENQICYEPEVTAAIEVFLPQNGIFVDVGSNWGHHSISAVESKNATVIAIEPNVAVFQDITLIKEDLDFHGNLSILNAALGTNDGTLCLIQDSFESGSASVDEKFLNYRNEKRRWPQRLLQLLTFQRKIRNVVHVKRLDDVCAKLKHLDLIKLDCEGVELDVLKSGEETIKRYEPNILFELHIHDTTQVDIYKKFFSEFNYSIYMLRANIAESNLTIAPLNKVVIGQRYDLLASRRLEPDWPFFN